MYRHSIQITLLAPLLVGVPITRATAQYTDYSQYYKQNVGNLQAAGTNRYLYDKYFYHNTAVSPYLSAVRGGSDYGTAYYTSVLPELRRREANERATAAYVQQRKLQGNVGYTVYPGAGFVGGTPADAYTQNRLPQSTTPSFYYNRWYSGWQNR
jgi:hypothetical protein